MPAITARTSTLKRKPPATAATPPTLLRGTERACHPGPAADLLTAWLPALAGIPQKLQSGAHVAHVGCASGTSLILLAMAHPASHFIGFDNDAASIAAARVAAHEAGVAHRVRFEIASAGGFARHRGYDLVILSGGLLDLVHPNTIARHVHQTLKPTGTWMILEPAPHTAHAHHHPHAPAAEDRLHEILHKAGFHHIRLAAHTPTLQILEARP